MNKQLIFETKIKLIDHVFQNQYTTKSDTQNVLDSMLVVNDSKNLVYGATLLDKTADLEFKALGDPNTGYSLVQITSNFPIILNFAVNQQQISLVTANFSYNNQNDKLKNIQILNSTLSLNSNSNTYFPVESSKNIDLRFMLIEHYDLKYTTFGDFYV